MNQRKNAVVQATSYLLSGDRNSRTARVAGAALGRMIDREGGKVTGRVIVAIVVVLAVVGVAFVAYRLLVLDLILNVLRERG
jgi:hypothetical protein